jgi:uncharacterized membrane protein (UPF0127 family)
MRQLFYVLVLALAMPAAAAAKAKPSQLTVDTARGRQSFAVEVVREEVDRNRGLMFRRHMARRHGMLFDYDPPQNVAFWMKNTYIPLDIIFIGADGRIINIYAMTTPLSLEPLPAGGPVRGVLEINGGLSAKLGIKPGDRVHHKLFDAK